MSLIKPVRLTEVDGTPVGTVGNPIHTTAQINGDVIVNDGAALTTASGTVAATNAAGGTEIIAANASRTYAQCQNNGAVDVYFGTGTVTSSYLKVVPSGTFTWDSQEALKVLSSGADCNIAFTDYIN